MEHSDCSFIESTLMFIPKASKQRRKIMYLVKSVAQKLKSDYKNHTLIADKSQKINEQNLFKIMDWAINGEIEELVVENKNVLVHFSLVQHIIKKYSDGKITVLDDFLIINDSDSESDQ
jgi:hypothetical protein